MKIKIEKYPETWAIEEESNTEDGLDSRQQVSLGNEEEARRTFFKNEIDDFLEGEIDIDDSCCRSVKAEFLYLNNQDAIKQEIKNEEEEKSLLESNEDIQNDSGEIMRNCSMSNSVVDQSMCQPAVQICMSRSDGVVQGERKANSGSVHLLEYVGCCSMNIKTSFPECFTPVNHADTNKPGISKSSEFSCWDPLPSINFQPTVVLQKLEHLRCSKCLKKNFHQTEFNKQLMVKEPTFCFVCVNTLSHSNKIIKAHTIKKPYDCTICGKSFSQMGHLNRHRKEHTGKKPLPCKICNMKFSRLDTLKIHRKTHSGRKQYKCTICTKIFSRSDTLDRHIKTHTGEKQFQCTICKQRFSQMATLNKHIRTHTAEKQYKCTVCTKMFSRSDSLKIHERIHTGEKPYQCNICAQSFSRSDTLNNHMKWHMVRSR